MLTSLDVQNIILIDRLRLSFKAGFSCLTGETGAGKSVLVDILGFVIGRKSHRVTIRDATNAGHVTARFMLPADHTIWPLLQQVGLCVKTTDDIVLRRTLRSNRRSRAYVNDHPITVAQLQAIGAHLVEIHGQHDGQNFLQSSTYLDILDRFGDHTPHLDAVSQAADALAQAQRKLDTTIAHHAQAGTEALMQQVRELSALTPQKGEAQHLAQERHRLKIAANVCDDLSEAARIVSQNTVAVALAGVLTRMEKTLPQLEGEDALSLQQAIASIDGALQEIEAAGHAVHHLAECYIVDTAALNQTEERLFALRTAARKYHCPVDALAEHHAKAVATLSTLPDQEAIIASLQAIRDQARNDYTHLAGLLSQHRQKAATALKRALTRELTPLKLDDIHFRIRLETDETHISSTGFDKVHFEISVAGYARFAEIRQIASGGELSRFVLALKAALMSRQQSRVVIFDEIDQGVGGAVADAIGERLNALGQHLQILVVTHAPQVAAKAQSHYFVSKAARRKRNVSHIHNLSKPERQEELARMISGAHISNEARAAAAKLLTPIDPIPQPATTAQSNPTSHTKRLLYA